MMKWKKKIQRVNGFRRPNPQLFFWFLFCLASSPFILFFESSRKGLPSKIQINFLLLTLSGGKKKMGRRLIFGTISTVVLSLMLVYFIRSREGKLNDQI